jgi:hypothetical protein
MQAMIPLSWSHSIVTCLPTRLTSLRDPDASDAANPLTRGMTPPIHAHAELCGSRRLGASYRDHRPSRHGSQARLRKAGYRDGGTVGQDKWQTVFSPYFMVRAVRKTQPSTADDQQ